jgi:hypothetical protein
MAGVENGWYTPGHCQDIDGFLVHEPGKCQGAVMNCNTRCCGPKVLYCSEHGEYLHGPECPKCIKEVMEWTA